MNLGIKDSIHGAFSVFMEHIQSVAVHNSEDIQSRSREIYSRGSGFCSYGNINDTNNFMVSVLGPSKIYLLLKLYLHLGLVKSRICPLLKVWAGSGFTVAGRTLSNKPAQKASLQKCSVFFSPK